MDFALHGSHFQKYRQSSLKSRDKASVPKKSHTQHQEYMLNLRKPKRVWGSKTHHSVSHWTRDREAHFWSCHSSVQKPTQFL